MILIENFVVYIKVFDYKVSLYFLKRQGLIEKFEDIHIFFRLNCFLCIAKDPKQKATFRVQSSLTLSLILTRNVAVNQRQFLRINVIDRLKC